MSTIPAEVSRDILVTVTVNGTSSDVPVSVRMMERIARAIELSSPALCEDNDELQAIRSCVVSIAIRAANEAAQRASWVAVSKMLGLDPDKGR
jgi:hypothetical protein